MELSVRVDNHFIAADKQFSIRRMQVEDFPNILPIENRVQSHPWKESHFTNCLQIGNETFVVVTGENDSAGKQRAEVIVAFAVVSVGGGEAELLNIAVAPEYQRRGIARYLLESIVAAIKSRADNLFLEVRRSNLAAIELYENLQFNQVGERRNYYPANNPKAGNREDALIYALTLI